MKFFKKKNYNLLVLILLCILALVMVMHVCVAGLGCTQESLETMKDDMKKKAINNIESELELLKQSMGEKEDEEVTIKDEKGKKTMFESLKKRMMNGKSKKTLKKMEPKKEEEKEEMVEDELEEV